LSTAMLWIMHDLHSILKNKLDKFVVNFEAFLSPWVVQMSIRLMNDFY
jgi:hypothetical protein